MVCVTSIIHVICLSLFFLWDVELCWYTYCTVYTCGVTVGRWLFTRCERMLTQEGLFFVHLKKVNNEMTFDIIMLLVTDDLNNAFS
jgi:hypothetical protein